MAGTHVLVQYVYKRTLLNKDAVYPDRLGHLGIFDENSTQLTCLEITSYRVQYSTVFWLLELNTQSDNYVMSLRL